MSFPRALVLAAVAGAALVPGGPAAGQSLPSHEPFTQVLREVVESPRVDYGALAQDRDGLDRYLASLAEVTPAALEAAPREDRLAFWINAYNACMLRLVVDHYPLEGGGGFMTRLKNFFADRPENSVWQIGDVFTRRHCAVAGEDRSQDEIEHEIIRPVFQDPRIHFAVNCAALSCPRLRTEAYRGSELNRQLDDQVAVFVDDPRHFRLESSPDATLRLNKVLDWYAEDFGGVEGLRDFFRPWLDEGTASRVADPETEVAFFEYDWTLNDTSP